MDKIALLIAGQPRTFEFCFPSLKKHILDVYRPDIFISTDDYGDRVYDLYKPTAMDIRSQEEIFDLAISKRGEIESVLPVNDLSIAWKVSKAAELKSDYEKQYNFTYDVVIRTRFDVKFKYVPQIKADNNFHVPIVGGYWITPPDKPGIHWKGYSSHLCWSSSEIMDKICNYYFDKADYLTLAVNSISEFGWAPEYVLKYFCDVNQINVKFENIEMMLIRGTSNNPLSFNNHKLSKFPDYR